MSEQRRDVLKMRTDWTFMEICSFTLRSVLSADIERKIHLNSLNSDYQVKDAALMQH